MRVYGIVDSYVQQFVKIPSGTTVSPRKKHNYLQSDTLECYPFGHVHVRVSLCFEREMLYSPVQKS